MASDNSEVLDSADAESTEVLGAYSKEGDPVALSPREIQDLVAGRISDERVAYVAPITHVPSTQHTLEFERRQRLQSQGVFNRLLKSRRSGADHLEIEKAVHSARQYLANKLPDLIAQGQQEGFSGDELLQEVKRRVQRDAWGYISTNHPKARGVEYPDVARAVWAEGAFALEDLTNEAMKRAGHVIGADEVGHRNDRVIRAKTESRRGRRPNTAEDKANQQRIGENLCSNIGGISRSWLAQLLGIEIETLYKHFQGVNGQWDYILGYAAAMTCGVEALMAGTSSSARTRIESKAAREIEVRVVAKLVAK
jgi:hypothetical protein